MCPKKSNSSQQKINATDACKNYFQEYRLLNNFIGFISHLALKTDEVSKITIKALYENDDPKKYESELKRIKKQGATKALRFHRRLLLEMMLCRAVDNYLCYMSELLALIFKTKPETLRSAETVKLDFIIGFSSMDELISEIADNKVNQLSYQGMRELDKYLGEKLGFEIFSDSDSKERAVQIIETRNLIVHARGAVNRIFVKRIPQCKSKPGDVVELKVTPVLENIEFLTDCVLVADKIAREKFDLPVNKVLAFSR